MAIHPQIVAGSHQTAGSLPAPRESHPHMVLIRPSPLPATASRPKIAITLGLWLDGSIIVPITGHRLAGSCPVVIAWLWSLPGGETTEVSKMVSLRCFSPADHGAAAMVAFARHKGNGKVFDGWVFGCQGSNPLQKQKQVEIFGISTCFLT